LVSYPKLKESVEANDVLDIRDDALLTFAKGKRIQDAALLDELACRTEEGGKCGNKIPRSSTSSASNDFLSLV
jgi:hypothetical protein